MAKFARFLPAYFPAFKAAEGYKERNCANACFFSEKSRMLNPI
jgi:hypothetical protein